MFDAKSLLNMIMGAGQQAGQQGAQGGLGGMLGNVLGGLQGKAQDAAQGAQTMAGGMGNDINDAVAKAKEAIQTGNYAGLAEQAKAMLQNNAGGLLAGGLAGLALGTGAGRSILGSAAKLGGVALVGGLAYKAYQNYQAGKPLASFGEPLLAAPAGSGFAEGDGDDNAKALLMVRAMIAAAAADGEIDDTERARIMGNLKQAGLDDEASGFLDEEFANPLDASGLVQMSSTPEMAAQIYTAARLAVDPDTDDEQTFLADLASGLSLDSELVAHIDAAAASVMQSQPV
jgi:uncharacterized membrane protein YebE (DUF533 family)